MLLNSWETRSDTFLFIDGKLALHERAEYDYTGDEEDIDWIYVILDQIYYIIYVHRKNWITQLL